MANSDKLAGVHPDLIARVTRVLAAMSALGFPMFVVSGVRTDAEQLALYHQGRTTPGKIVTNCDGVIKRSNHQTHSDGLGHAVDCAFVDNKLTVEDETWSPNSPWSAYGALAKAVGLHWGGDWVSSLNDRPHVELP